MEYQIARLVIARGPQRAGSFDIDLASLCPIAALDLRRNMRADLFVVIGMCMIVASLFLTWERYHYTPSGAAALGTMYLHSLEVLRTGFSIPEKFWLITLPLVSGFLLIFTPNAKTSKLICGLMVACGVGCFVIAIRRFALLPGAITGFLGALTLLIGSIERYQVFNTNRKDS